jgi:hypothetical protein
MADFGGFQVLTPQEIQAQQQAQRQQVFSQGTPPQQRSANIEFALDNLFGNPQQRQAQQMQTRIQNAQKGVERNEGESDVDFELRRLQNVRDAVADVDPATASQINQQMLKLGTVKFERARLMASDTREADEHALKMDELKDAARLRGLTGGTTYVMNSKTGAMEGFDLLDPDQGKPFQESAAKPGTIVITPAQATQIYLNDSDNAARLREAMAKASNSGSKVELKDIEKATAGLLDVYETSDRLFQVLEQNPDALTAASAGAMKFDKVATELAAAGRMANGGKTKEGQSIDDWLKANAITNSRAQSLVVALAASTARANNPDGRISDRDMSIATEMVGGNNPNPAVVMANLNDNLVRSSRSLIGRLDSADPGTKEAMQKRRDLLDQKYKTFSERLAKYAQGSRGPGATGAPQTGAPDADGWQTINGRRVRLKQGQ